MRKIALDLGVKTCGFAISDKEAKIAFFLENFFFEQWHFVEVIKRLKHYLYESQYQNEIDCIVLGYPLRMDLSKSSRTVMVEKFHARLQKEIDIPIVLQDERESTIAAQNILFDLGYNTKKMKPLKDGIAAQVILEDYLKRIN
ncbi:Putative Holliday junction resolvase [Metamycoplasma auris 15026]|uniref:Putative pre-16S rRNA nuclease n=1 Tax=Metamycoplasma auris 15026 TaxID=1188233 RepID=N9V9X8_9BACT|nr:Holliday junction resolvase RuvX [Metamycoplasma auris]ENY68503.1 Putative Holliday junction resolvase [Metamycoplasma auris 15026]